MSKIGKTIIVLLISLAAWIGVAFITHGFGGMDETAEPIVIFLVPIFIMIFYYNSAEEAISNVKKT